MVPPARRRGEPQKTVNEMLDHVSVRPVRVIRIFRLN
jgi:hypothetical protein